jgi:hypothetical protein
LSLKSEEGSGPLANGGYNLKGEPIKASQARLGGSGDVEILFFYKNIN